MAVFNKFESFSEALANGQIDCTNNALYIFLTNDTPNYATNTVKADLTEIAGGNGYVSGGADTQNTVSRTGGVTSVIGVDVVWTATGGPIPSAGVGFRYVVLYDATAAGDPLIGAWDYGSTISLAAGETLTVDFGSSMFTVT
jgi:hypothetical protein